LGNSADVVCGRFVTGQTGDDLGITVQQRRIGPDRQRDLYRKRAIARGFLM
jgi:hypothetical protein